MQLQLVKKIYSVKISRQQFSGFKKGRFVDIL